jgi:predicted nucleotidyltransferase
MIATTDIQDTLQKLVGKLVAEYAPEKVILFGSYAYGQPDDDSDLDLLIVKQTTDRFIDRWTTVQEILSDPTRRTPLETLVMTPQEVQKRLDVGDQFVAEILNKGRVLYAR